ncbi:hypothetical protein [uncultured Nostoc sp.]|uniref:hypothetical protein n=1 Tax=uncultured Nostoc sp. TaxID=340711 RepID=UPI0035CAE1A6
MSAALASKPSKSSSDRKSESPYKRLHVIIPIEDMLWASQQKSSVTQLWQECWTSDPYGSRWMSLTTNLGYSTFIQAKKILSESGLFIFKPDKSIQDGRETVGWIVRNLHGSRMKDFWEEVDSTKQEIDSEKQQPNSEDKEIDTVPEKMRASNQAPISGQTQSEQAFQEPSRTVHEHITNSSKEFVMCVSSTPNEISLGEETAIAHSGCASPQIVEGVEEKEEESPTATDCTTLTLVDAAPSQPTSLLAENEISGVEPKDCSSGLSSAAPAVLPLKNLTNTEILDILDAANQGVCPGIEAITVLMKTPHSRSLMGAITNNPQWGINLSDYSTVPQSSKLRSQREAKLKSFATRQEQPPSDFLQECLDDPLLKIKLKRLSLTHNWNIQDLLSAQEGNE